MAEYHLKSGSTWSSSGCNLPYKLIDFEDDGRQKPERIRMMQGANTQITAKMIILETMHHTVDVLV